MIVLFDELMKIKMLAPKSNENRNKVWMLPDSIAAKSAMKLIIYQPINTAILKPRLRFKYF